MKNFSSNQFQPCILSGLLLGLSVPSFSFLPLGFLAWAWLVPLLFELKKTDHFLPFLARVLVSVGIGFSIITLWVVNASLLGFFASAAMGIFVWTVPLVLFYFVRRFWNRTVALVSLPFVWTSWEWLYHQTEFSFGAVRLGYTQADMLWLIQYADTTGVEGVTFWLVLLNVALFVFVERQFGGGANNKFNRSAIFNRRAILPAALFALPLAYAAYVFLKPQPPAKEITVLAVQPNVSPFVEYSPKRMTEIFGKQLALTDRAVKTESPDLIVWHEVAVPYILSDDAAANGYLAKQIAKWNAPVLTGAIQVKDYAKNEPRPPLLEAQNRSREFFNAAALFEPAQIQNERLPIDLSPNGDYFENPDDPGDTLPNSTNTFIAKFDLDGVNSWVEVLDNADLVGVSQITVSGAGEIYLTGFFLNSVTFPTAPKPTTLIETEGSGEDEESEGGYIAKMDTNGNFLWAKGFGGIGEDIALAPDLIPDNGVDDFACRRRFYHGEYDVSLFADGCRGR